MKELKSWQVSLSQSLISVPARILPREKITMGIPEDNSVCIKCDPGSKNDWTSELKSKLIYSLEFKKKSTQAMDYFMVNPKAWYYTYLFTRLEVLSY